MTIVQKLELHRDICKVCGPSQICRTAQGLLKQLAESLVVQPPVPEVIDLEAHKTECSTCRTRALCATGRSIVTMASTALLEASRGVGKKRGRA